GDGRDAASADLRLGNVMAAAGCALAYAGDVVFGRIQSTEPHEDIMRCRGLAQACRDGVSTERGLEGMVALVGNRGFQPTHAFLPCFGIRLRLRTSERGEQVAGIVVRVEPCPAAAPEAVAADGTLARAIDARQDQDSWPAHASELVAGEDLSAQIEGLVEQAVEGLAGTRCIEPGQTLVVLAPQGIQHGPVLVAGRDRKST